MDEAAIKALVTALTAGATFKQPNGTESILVPGDMRSIDFTNVNPNGVYQCRTFERLESFIDYVRRFANEATSIYLTDSAAVAVIDHPHPTDAEMPHVPAELHRAVYPMPRSVEWGQWTAHNGRKQEQREFAEMLDEHAADVVEPDGATLLEIVMTMRSLTSVEFSSKVVLNNDRINLTYREVEEAKAGRDQELVVPQEFTLGVPVFDGGERFEVKAKLIYSTRSGDLKLGYKLRRPDLVVRAAVKGVAEKIENELSDLPLYYGES